MITGNVILDNQTICEGSSPATINGDVPGGGAGPGTFTYQWQNSTNGSTFNVMPDITTEDLTGTPLTATTWYQRTAYSSVCSDTSDDIKITVDPAITDYQINLAALAHDTLATGQIPGLLQGTPAGGLGAFTFGWEASTDNTNFSGLPAAGETYQSGALNATTWFRRTVTSGECSVTSTFKITILPVLAGNTIASDQRVCNDVPPAMVTGSTPTGGDGKYRYLWEKKDTESPDWVTAGGISNTINYQPPVLGENTQYRRQAFSGENNCCTSVSPVVTVTVDTMPLNISAGANRELLPFELAVNLDGNFEGTGTCEWSFSPVSGEGDIPIIADPADMKTAVTKLNFGDNVFEFTVNNGECNAGPFNVTITVPEIMIPQGISPDDDGSNDYFDVKGLQFTHNELVIINTGGAVVFRMQDYQSDDPDLAWKGLDNYGDPLPDGTYYFLLTIKGSTDPDVPAFTTHLSGFIIIRR